MFLAYGSLIVFIVLFFKCLNKIYYKKLTWQLATICLLWGLASLLNFLMPTPF